MSQPRSTSTYRLWACGLVLGLAAAGLVLGYGSKERLVHYPPLAASYPYLITRDELKQNAEATGKPVESVEDGLRLVENTTLDFDVTLPTTGVTPLFLVARGTPALYTYPRVSVTVDHAFVAGLFVTSADWGLFRVLVPLARGRHTVELAYVNDAFAYPADRNLDLQTCSIGCLPPATDGFYRWRAPCAMTPSRMSVQNYAEPGVRAVLLQANGELADDVCFERPGVFPLQLALSRPKLSPHPGLLQVALDGVACTTIVLDSTTPAIHAVRLEAGQGLHRVTVMNRSPSRDTPIRVDGLWIGDLHATLPQTPMRLTPSSSPIRVSGASFDFQSEGNRLDADDWALWSNGYLQQRLDCAEPGDWRITVTARGDRCEGIGPRMLLMVDRNQLAAFQVSETEFRDYAIPVRLAAGPHDVFLVFDNDQQVPGQGDRNLYVRDMVIAGELH